MRSTTRSLPVHTSPGEDPIVPTHSPGEACQRKLSTFVDFVSNICGAPLLVFVLHMALIRWTHRSICAMIRNRATRSEHLNSESTADLGGCSEGCMEPKPASLRSVSAIRNHNFSVCPLSNHINWGIMHPKSAKSSQTTELMFLMMSQLASRSLWLSGSQRFVLQAVLTLWPQGVKGYLSLQRPGLVWWPFIAYEPSRVSRCDFSGLVIERRLRLLQQAVFDWHIGCQQSTAKKCIARTWGLQHSYPLHPLPRYTWLVWSRFGSTWDPRWPKRRWVLYNYILDDHAIMHWQAKHKTGHAVMIKVTPKPVWSLVQWV